MEETNCKLCFKQYDYKLRIPKIINCGHTYCNVCLFKEFKINKQIKCYEDNIIFNDDNLDINNLPTNISLLNMISKSNKNIKINKDLSQGNDICEIHNKILDLICLNDYKMICNNCGLFGKHKNHSLINLEEFFIKISEKSQNLINLKEKIKTKNKFINSEKFKENLKNIIKNKINFYLDEINKKFNILQKNLEEHKQKLINQVYSINSEVLLEFKLVFNEINNLQEKEVQLNEEIKLILNKLDSNKKIDLEYLTKNLFKNNRIEDLFIDLLSKLDNKEKESIKNLNNKFKKWDFKFNIENVLKEINNSIQLEKKFENNLNHSFSFENNYLNKSNENLLDLNDNDDFYLNNSIKEELNLKKSFLTLKRKKLNKTNSLLLGKNFLKNDKKFEINEKVKEKVKEKKPSFIKKDANSKFIFNLSSKDFLDKDIINKIPLIKSKTFLKKLILNNNKITDFGFKNILIKLKDCKYLEYIDVSNNLLTDISINLIYNHYKNYNNLKKFEIKNNKININNVKSKYSKIYNKLIEDDIKITF